MDQPSVSSATLSFLDPPTMVSVGICVSLKARGHRPSILNYLEYIYTYLYIPRENSASVRRGKNVESERIDALKNHLRKANRDHCVKTRQASFMPIPGGQRERQPGSGSRFCCSWEGCIPILFER